MPDSPLPDSPPERINPGTEPSGDTAIDLDRFLPYRLSVLSNTVSGAIARDYADRFDLTIPEWRIMCVLAIEDALSAKEIAARTRMDKVQVSRATARLDAKGLVARGEDSADRRRQPLSMTPAGWTIYRTVAPAARQVEQDLLARLSPQDRAVLEALVERLQTAADEIDAGIAGGSAR